MAKQHRPIRIAHLLYIVQSIARVKSSLAASSPTRFSFANNAKLPRAVGQAVQHTILYVLAAFRLPYH